MEASEHIDEERAREQAVGVAASDLTTALVKLYRAFDGDELAVGEVEHECHKAARGSYLDPR